MYVLALNSCMTVLFNWSSFMVFLEIYVYECLIFDVGLYLHDCICPASCFQVIVENIERLFASVDPGTSSGRNEVEF